MIINGVDDVTSTVVAAYEKTPDPRTREILVAMIKHLHAFCREVKLTEPEFQQATRLIAELGHWTTESNNEVVLAAGSLGISSLVCLMNNGNNGQTETAANLLGPNWRDDAPFVENGGSLLRSPTDGIPLIFTGHVRDPAGNPVVGARVDVWQSSTIGLYENQDPTQAEFNLRGVLKTDAKGDFWFRSVKPAGYPVPIEGPVGKLLGAAGRHNMRPAHMHAMIHHPGFKTIASQIYTSDDPYLETDAQFGVTRALIGNYVLHEGDEPHWTLDYTFGLEAGEAWMPKPPISAQRKAA